jgi:hypothetical protein
MRSLHVPEDDAEAERYGAQLVKGQQADILALFIKMGSDKQFERRLKACSKKSSQMTFI